MAKFGKKSNTTQDIPTAALPDIIFMLLFFFMVTTVLRETDILVKQKLPKAAQLSKLCLLYTSPSPRDGLLSRMPSSA